jgi:hypothetical protein
MFARARSPNKFAIRALSLKRHVFIEARLMHAVFDE